MLIQLVHSNSSAAGDTVVSSCTTGALRLAGRTTATSGRLEWCLNGAWGTVCSSEWNSFDAVVAGMPTARISDQHWQVYPWLSPSTFLHTYYTYTGMTVPLTSSDYAGIGSGPIFVYESFCNGKQYNLDECRLSWFSSESRECSHFDDVTLKCVGQCFYM